MFHLADVPLMRQTIKNPEKNLRVLFERLAATYSRGSYTTTTIGHAAFDGRVRNGNGSDHCGNATKLMRTRFDVQNLLKRSIPKCFGDSLKTIHSSLLAYNSRVEIAFPIKEKAIKPHDRLVLVS